MLTTNPFRVPEIQMEHHSKQHLHLIGKISDGSKILLAMTEVSVYVPSFYHLSQPYPSIISSKNSFSFFRFSIITSYARFL